MGGLHQCVQRSVVVSFQILGNIPGIGALFRKRATLDKPRYLLIFVTATLIDEDGSFITYENPEPGLPAPVRVPKGLNTSSSSAFPAAPKPATKPKPAESNPPQ